MLAFRLPRMSRNVVDLALINSELRKCGMTLVSITESGVPTPTDRLIEDVIKLMNDSYRAQHSEDTRRGIEASRRRREGC